MSSVELENLARIGSLERMPVSSAELEALASSGRERLADAATAGLALASRFDLAYNAAHALALAGLRRAGYRSKSRYLVFATLPHTLGLSSRTCRVLLEAHKERNRLEYDGAANLSEALVKALLAATAEVADRLAEAGRGPVER